MLPPVAPLDGRPLLDVILDARDRLGDVFRLGELAAGASEGAILPAWREGLRLHPVVPTAPRAAATGVELVPWSGGLGA